MLKLLAKAILTSQKIVNNYLNFPPIDINLYLNYMLPKNLKMKFLHLINFSKK